MNGAYLAAIVVVVVLVAVLVLKKINSRKRPANLEAKEGPRLTAPEQSEESLPHEPLITEPNEEETASSSISESAAETPEPVKRPMGEEQDAEPALENEQSDTTEEVLLLDEEDLKENDTEEEALLLDEEDLAEPAITEEPAAQEPFESPVDKSQHDTNIEFAEQTEEPVAEESPLASDEPGTLAEEDEELSEIPEQTPLKSEEDSATAIRFSLETYTERLNQREERQRVLLDEAITGRKDKERDKLQRELVIMNSRLALIEEHYTQERHCYEQVLDLLIELKNDKNNPDANEAISYLKQGDPTLAETYLAEISKLKKPTAAAAAFHCGQLANCRVDLQKALDFYTLAVDKEPTNPQFLQGAGKTARDLYNYKESLAWLVAFVKILKGTPEMDPMALALAQRELAYTYVLSGQYQKAGPLYKESMTAMAKQLGQDHPEMATSWFQIGELQETVGEYDKAVSLYKKSLLILERKKGNDHPSLAPVLTKLAALCMELELEKEAVPLYERLVAILEKTLRPTHPQLALSLNNLAESYRLQGQYEKAEACYQKSLTINEAIYGSSHPSVAAILQELGKLCNSQRKPEEARQYQERAAAIFQKSVESANNQPAKESLTLDF